MLCISNNSIKHLPFVYTESNGQRVLFLTIRFNISHLFAHSLNVKQLYLIHGSGPIKCFHSGLEWTWQCRDILHSLKLWGWSLTISIITRHSGWGVLLFSRDTVGVFYSPSQLGWFSALKLLSLCKRHWQLVLYFGLRPDQKCHSKVMHRKEVTHSNGSYERKSRGRKLADEMGRAKKIPMVHS